MDNDDTLLNNRGPQPGNMAETVYGTDDNNMVMSEKVGTYFNYCLRFIITPVSPILRYF